MARTPVIENLVATPYGTVLLRDGLTKDDLEAFLAQHQDELAAAGSVVRFDGMVLEKSWERDGAPRLLLQTVMC